MKLLKSSKGFTLLEVLIAVAIATMAFTSMGYILGHGFLMADENRSHMHALNMLRREMENVRSTDYTDSSLDLGSRSFSIDLNVHGNPVLQNATAMRIVQGSPFGVSDTNTKKVTIQVRWTTRSGRTLTESLTTYVTRVGINRG